MNSRKKPPKEWASESHPKNHKTASGHKRGREFFSKILKNSGRLCGAPVNPRTDASVRDKLWQGLKTDSFQEQRSFVEERRKEVLHSREDLRHKNPEDNDHSRKPDGSSHGARRSESVS